MLLPEKEKTPAPEPVMYFSYLMIFVMWNDFLKVSNSETKTGVTKKEELKVENNSPKNLSTTDKVKSSASANVSWLLNFYRYV